MPIPDHFFRHFSRDTHGFVSPGEAFAALVLAGAVTYGYDAVRLHQVEQDARYAAELASRVAAMDYARHLRTGNMPAQAQTDVRDEARAIFQRQFNVEGGPVVDPDLSIELGARKNEARVTLRATGGIETTFLSLLGVHEMTYAIEITASSRIERPDLPPPPPKPELLGAST